MRSNLTAAFIASVKPPARGRLALWDDTFPGFGLRVTSGGRKTWVITYRFDGRPRMATLGHYPGIGLADARGIAREKLTEASRGTDPGASKAARRRAETFADLARLYLEKHAPRKRSAREDRRIIDKDLLPAWGSRKAREIRRADVIQVLDRIVDRGSPGMANNTRALISKLFNFALGRDLVDVNPVAGVARPGQARRRDRVLSPDEIRTLWRELDAWPAKIGAGFRLALATAQRRGEVLGMRWNELDLEAGAWTIPAERSKNGLPHRVSLGPVALAILHRQRKEVSPDCPFVLPGRGGAFPLLNIHHRDETKIRQAVGFAFCFHDLRRTAATEMGRLGVSRDSIGAVLNHADRGVTAVYDRATRDKEKSRALTRWDRRLTAIVAGEEGGELVRLAPR
jgi:integrase